MIGRITTTQTEIQVEDELDNVSDDVGNENQVELMLKEESRDYLATHFEDLSSSEDESDEDEYH